MTRVLVVHGPNLNLLGEREPEIYGRTSLAEIDASLGEEAARFGWELETFQSNHEGALIDRIQEARSRVSGIVLNPGGFTHTSIALRDAVAAAGVPVVEVHLSNIFAREDFRREDRIAAACAGLVLGFGPASYRIALHALRELLG